MTARVSDVERLRRWRLVLGAADEAPDGGASTLSGDDARIDRALGAVYDSRPREQRGGRRSGGLQRSAPAVARWLGDIRRYFPTPVVRVLQHDAIERLDLRQLLLEPEMLATVEPDVHLAALLVELSALVPEQTRATARLVVQRVVDDLVERLSARTRQAVHGALAQAERTRRPRPADIDWHRTIRANLRHWLPEQRTVVPAQLIGASRRRHRLARDVIIAIDQSGSMADSVVHAAVFGGVLASIPALRTHVVAFDTSVTDLTAVAADPVEVLFGVQLGGGTDIGAALAYCRTLIERPSQTLVIVVSDLYDGGAPGAVETRVEELVRAGVTVLVLLALSDDGAPVYDHRLAEALAERGVVSLACTPDAMPDLLAAALEGRDLPTDGSQRAPQTRGPLP
jgi:Mg-chelatase subunit ChlD